MAEPTHWTSADLLARYCNGDSTAAEQIFARYTERLLRLTQAKLTSRLATRLDPEDVAMSAWRSFFVGAKQNQFSLTESGDLWRLLVSITLHKLYRRVRHHQAEKRDVNREQPIARTPAEPLCTSMACPSAEEALALADELEFVMAKLDASGRRVLELRLQGEQIAVIAELTARSERTVRRNLTQIKKLLVDRLGGAALAPSRLTAHSSAVVHDRPASAFAGAATNVSFLNAADYLLQRMLGAGRFGKVYRALHRPTGETVAVKHLRKEHLSSSEVVERFVAEAELLSRLQHPGIVKLHGLGQTPGGGYFLVTEWIDGPNLAELLNRGLPDPARVVRWGMQLCSALDHAHEQGIIHCDVKPNNLLVDAKDRLHLTDFGLAFSGPADSAQQRGMHGTPAFMAPEQVASWWGPIDRRTDVYGVGAVLFTLLTGRPPWSDQRAPDRLCRILSTEPVVSVESLRRDMSPALCEICKRCLAKNRAERFEDMQSLSSALENACDAARSCSPTSQSG